jgi:class 3 adenylate cyclase/TolB-like protein
MAEERVERQLAVILAADVVGYSRLMERDEAGTFERLRASRKEVFEPEIARRRGRIFKLMGDGLLAEFGSVVDAVECAVLLQRAMAERNSALSEAQRIEVRIGINLGEVIVEGDDRYGEGVNIAARLQQLAEPGGICVSGKVAKEVEGKLSFAFEPMGEHRVKNIAEPVTAFRVKMDGTPARATRRLKRTGRWPLMAAAALAACIAAGLAWWTIRGDTSRIAPPGASIAVLPFDNLSDDKQQGYLADGIAEDLTTELARVPGLFVVSRNAAFGYRDKGLAPAEIAAQLNVRYILEGSVRRAGDDIRVNAQLIDTTTGGHLWAERYDGAWAEIFTLQNQVVEKVANALKLRLVASQHAADVAGGTSNPVAYETFLRGLELEYRGAPEDWAKAVTLYQQAVALDPNFGRATAQIAWVYWNASGQDAVQKALGLSYDDVYAKANAFLAEAEKHPSPRYYQIRADRLMYAHKSDEAVAAAERAIALDPSDPDGYTQMSAALIFNGRPAEALEYLDKTMQVEPGWTPWRRYLSGLADYSLKRYDGTIATLQQLDPKPKTTSNTFWGNYFGRWVLLAAYGQLGRTADAAALRKELMPYVAEANDPDMTGLLAMSFLPFKNYADLALVLDGLHKAGVPDLPFGMDARAQDRLTAKDIAALVLDSENEGHEIDSGTPSSGKILADGTFYAHVGDWRATGASWIEGDTLCYDFPDTFRQCGAFLRNPGGTFEQRNEYLFVSPRNRFEFSFTN